MTTYAFRDARGDVYLLAPEFAKPTPVHAQQASSLAAVEAHRRQGVELRLQKDAATIVTDHGRPALVPYDGDVVTRNARALIRQAESAGFEVKLLEFPDACRVEGMHRGRRVGFTVTWTRGRAAGASWHAPWKYGIIQDDRPIGVNAKTRTALAGKRGAGMGTTRLTILASPRGLPINHATLNERISS